MGKAQPHPGELKLDPGRSLGNGKFKRALSPSKNTDEDKCRSTKQIKTSSETLRSRKKSVL